MTVEEALQALANEPGARNAKTRIYIYGVHESQPKNLDVKASASRRGDMEDDLRAIQADKQAQEALIRMEYARAYPHPPAAVANMIERQIKRDVAAYEQARMVEFATEQMGFSYSRVLGIWVAS